MGIALSSMCAVPIMRWGEKALADCQAQKKTVIFNVCPAYGKKVAVIGGKHVLAAAKEGILKRAADAGIEVIGVMSARFLPEMIFRPTVMPWVLL